MFAAVVVMLTAGLAAAQSSPSKGPAQSSTTAGAGPNQVVQRYCAGCHSERLKTGGVVLESLDIAQAGEAAETWEKVVRKVRAGAMPPLGSPRPAKDVADDLARSLESRLDAAALAHPNPGRPLLHRLNRSEYANAIRDLLALEVDTAALLPADDAAYGFDNIADVLGVSPSLQERYLTAAERIAALAVGSMDLLPSSVTYRIPQDLSQNQHIEGLPLGTIGGVGAQHFFPLDGEYEFQAKLLRTNLDIVRGLEFPSDVEFTLDGERIHLARIGGNDDLAQLFAGAFDASDAVDARLRVRVKVKAGPRNVTAAFLQGSGIESPTRLQPFLRSSADNFDWSGWPHLQTFSIAGPFNATGPGKTPSRERIFICRPSQPSEETACARQILSTLARRAYREPVSDADLARILEFYEMGRGLAAKDRNGKAGSFESGIELGLRRILSSPKFVFRAETDPPGVAPGSIYPVSDVELASRLSFFLWSSIPDDELLAAAEAGRLHDPEVLGAQLRRMLADPKSRALVDNFAGQWLQLRNVRNVQPNSNEFPDFDDNLRRAFQQETELLFQSIIDEDRSVLDLLTADYTFVNERLAKHYGIPGIYGSHFRRVPVAGDYRRGLLGHGSMLAVTSHAERTSPVVRGKWILENILGMPVPPPPPDVPPLRESVEGEAPRTMREQMVEHRANPVCASCHAIMDPVGLAMENFDAVGAWRTHEGGKPLDVSGELADGTRVEGVAGLRDAILAQQEAFVRTMTEKMLTYALGRGLDYHDMPVVRGIVRDAADGGYRFSDLIAGVARSVPFQFRMAGEAAASGAE